MLENRTTDLIHPGRLPNTLCCTERGNVVTQMDLFSRSYQTGGKWAQCRHGIYDLEMTVQMGFETFWNFGSLQKPGPSNRLQPAEISGPVSVAHCVLITDVPAQRATTPQWSIWRIINSKDLEGYRDLCVTAMHWGSPTAPLAPPPSHPNKNSKFIDVTLSNVIFYNELKSITSSDAIVISLLSTSGSHPTLWEALH